MVDYESLKTVFLKYGIWLLVPLLAIYGLDFVRLLAFLAQCTCIVYVCLLSGGLIYGMYLALSDAGESKANPLGELILKTRLVKVVVPSISWAYAFVQWSLKDIGSEIDG